MIYFNNTATSFPKPENVIKAVIEILNSPPTHSSRSGIEEESQDIFFTCRIKLAKLFNAPDPIRIVFTSGSTEALNLAIKGLDLQGGHIVSTKIEHNSVIRPLKTLEEEGKIELTFVDCDKYGYVESGNIENAIHQNTKAIIVNHCSNVTGAVLDIKTISAIAKKHSCKIIVDASQAAGCLPIDVRDWEIDLMAFTGHKSLFGLQGIGGLYIRDGIELKPLKTGGTGIKSEYLTQPKIMPIYYEAGTQNLPGVVSLNAGLDFISETGIDVIQRKKERHISYITDELKNYDRITIYNSINNSSGTVFTFNIDGMVPEEVNYILESSYNIHVRSGLHCAPLMLDALNVRPWGTVRASPSYFSTDEEVEKFIMAIKEIMRSFAGKK
ncbi:MAG: Aminotransferase class V-fold PLP-dependent enzyme [Ignavibacteria bacterium]|nr:Aminotransferase class V-fold PLP-dependent enzyme [Ignavibacteria bacterium]